MKKLIFILLFFLILTVAMTFPLAFKINTHIPGAFDTTEVYSTIWTGWQFKYAFENKLDLNTYHFASYPFGLPATKEVVFPVGMFIIKWLSILANEVFMYNFQILLSFWLSGLFSFLLVQYLTKNVFAAVFSGIIYSFCPYHFARAWQHLGLAQIEWMPLYIYALLKLREERRFKNAIFVSLVFFLFSENYTYAYFMIVTTIIFALYIFVYKKQEEKTKIFKLFALIIFFTFLITLPTTYIVYKNLIFGPSKEAMSLYHRSFEDLFSQSARPLSYILPSIFHPIFGKFTQLFMGYNLYGNIFTEHTLYLGWVPLILAFIAVKSWRGRRSHYKLSVKNENFYIGFFVVLAIVAWFFSQPPWWKIGPIKIYMPSFFMYKILPMFRAYCRFGSVVMLAIAVLAGFGAKFILERFKTQKIKVTITALFCSLVLFEFLNFPPFKVIDVSKAPQVYSWLKDQPGDFAIAEYPLDIDSPNQMYQFYQTKHQKRIINSTIPGTYANKVAKTIARLSEPNTARVLRWMGVKYVLIHRQSYLNTELIEWIEELNKIPLNSNLKLIRSFPAQECPQKDIMCVQKTGPVDVYEVIAMPVEPKVE